jgi:DNA repair protein RecO
MATYLTDDAICLRVHDFSETSQIVGLFTHSHGMVPLIAKGVKRESKKGVVSGPLDLLTGGEVVYVPAKGTGGAASASARGGSDLGTLAAWDLVDHRTDLRKNLPALNAAMLCAEVTTMLVQPHDPHPTLFDELAATLSLLAGPQRPRLAVAYVKAALREAGYEAQWETCLACGRKLVSDSPVRFSPRAGGFACAAEGERRGACSLDNAGVTIAAPGRVIIALSRLPAPTALAASPPDRPADAAALGLAMQLLLAQVEAVTDKPVRTRYLLKSIFSSDATVNVVAPWAPPAESASHT